MGSCCFQLKLPQITNIQDNKDPEDVKKNICLLLGVDYAGKSTFRKRTQMLANKLKHKGVVYNVSSQHKSMYQQTTMCAILRSLYYLTRVATHCGLVADDIKTKCIINAAKAKAKEDLNNKIISGKKLNTLKEHIDNYGLLFTALNDDDNDDNNQESIENCNNVNINHLIEPFKIPYKIEQCFNDMQSKRLCGKMYLTTIQLMHFYNFFNHKNSN